MREVINSALPWPNGWRLSGGFDDILVPMIIAAELIESDKECQASVIKATEPETIPAQYFIPNNKILTMIDSKPSEYANLFLFLE